MIPQATTFPAQMTVLYIASFIAGLLVGVAIMLFGIERRPREIAVAPFGPLAMTAMKVRTELGTLPST